MEKKEVIHITIAVIIMSIVLSLFNSSISLSLEGGINYLILLFYSAIIILISVFAKKIKADSIDIKIKHSIWGFQRYWFPKNRKFKKPIPAGIIFPLLFSFLSQGYIKFLAFLQFEAIPLVTRVTKISGKKYHLFEALEWDLGRVAFTGLISTLILSVLAHLLSFGELAKLSLYYSISNLIPFSQIDGMKIFFGSGIPGYKRLLLRVPLYILSLILTIITVIIVLV